MNESPPPDFKLIQFPKEKTFRERIRFDELPPAESALAVEKLKLDYIAYLSQMMILRLSDHMDEMGVDDSGDEFENDIQLVHEAIVSLLKRIQGLDHKFQRIAEDLEIDPELQGKIAMSKEDDEDEEDPEPPRYA